MAQEKNCTENAYNSWTEKRDVYKTRAAEEEFLRSLPKVESHYCQKSLTKLHMEPMWESKTPIHNTTWQSDPRKKKL